MLTVITLLKVKSSPNGEQHGERAFWRTEGPRYLNRWLDGVHRYVPEPKRVVVMTDIHEWYMIDGADRVDLDTTVDAPGFWSKLNMFRPEVSSGKCLYLDLDNVINGPLDELCALEPDPLIMLDDRRVPGLPNGSAILFDAERCRHIWNAYAEDARWIEGEYIARGDDYSMAYDQAFIGEMIVDAGHGRPPFFQNLLPSGYILNALSELPTAENWQDARLIFGCGGSKEGKPHTASHPAFALR